MTAERVGVAMTGSGWRSRVVGSRLVGGVARCARRAWYVVAAAGALALIPAGAASATTPLAAGAKKHDRNVGQVILGLVVILVILAVLFLLFRAVRKRTRG